MSGNRRGRRLYLPTFAVAVAAGWLAWTGWAELSEDSPVAAIHSAQVELAGPAVVCFVLAVFVIEQIRPAERHPLLARGHVLDMTYLLAYALVLVPLIALIGTGFSAELARSVPWLELPRVAAVPHWLFIAAAVVAIDAVDWLAHLGNHRIRSLWRLHAVHHSQEELSILTTFRAHPLVHRQAGHQPGHGPDDLGRAVRPGRVPGARRAASADWAGRAAGAGRPAGRLGALHRRRRAARRLRPDPPALLGIAYRHVKTLDQLFLVQVIAAFVIEIVAVLLTAVTAWVMTRTARA